MKAVDFDYVRAASLEEACRLLAEAGEEAKLIAGGQSLVPLLAMRLARPSLLIDINRLSELEGISLEDGQLRLGALTRQATALADIRVQGEAPLLAKALALVGHGQTRNRGTLGGSLAHADPAAEIGLATLALDGEIIARSAAGERRIPARHFFTGPMTTTLASDECLTEVRFARRPRAGRCGAGFREMSMRHGDFALVAVAVELMLDGEGVCRRAALSVGGVGGAPVRLEAAAAPLLGTRLGEGDLAAAAELVRESLAPQSDQHASADYRRRLAFVLAREALAEARDEALRAGA